jgi:hypothetical protein
MARGKDKRCPFEHHLVLSSELIVPLVRRGLVSQVDGRWLTWVCDHLHRECRRLYGGERCAIPLRSDGNFEGFRVFQLVSGVPVVSGWGDGKGFLVNVANIIEVRRAGHVILEGASVWASRPLRKVEISVSSDVVGHCRVVFGARLGDGGKSRSSWAVVDDDDVDVVWDVCASDMGIHADYVCSYVGGSASTREDCIVLLIRDVSYSLVKHNRNICVRDIRHPILAIGWIGGEMLQVRDLGS